MLRTIILMLFCILLASCSFNGSEKCDVKKEFYSNGQLKTLVYKYNKDDIKKIGFSSKGIIDNLQFISNNGRDNFMVLFDGEGKLWMIAPHRNDKNNGKFFSFDEGDIVLEEDYKDDVLKK